MNAYEIAGTIIGLLGTGSLVVWAVYVSYVPAGCRGR